MDNTALLEERMGLITKRNLDAERYLILIDLVARKIERAKNVEELLGMEEVSKKLKERLRVIDRQLRDSGYTGELTSGC